MSPILILSFITLSISLITCEDELSEVLKDTQIFQASPRTLHHLEGEKKFLKNLEKYIETMENNLKNLKKYVEKTMGVYDNKDVNYEEVFSNPINTYLLMRRSTVDIEDLIKVQINQPIEKLKQNVEDLRSSRLLATPEDFKIAADGFVTLQATYELETPAIRHGYLISSIFRDIPPNSAEPLTYNDCRLLAVHAINILNFEIHHEWKNQAKLLEDMGHEDLLTLSPFTDERYVTIDETVQKLKDVGYKTDPAPKDDTPKSTSFCPMFGPSKLRKNYTTILYDTTITEMQMIEQFERLCRGERIRPIAWDSELHCELFKGYDPYYRLQPIKLEQVSMDPYIVVLRDVISDREMNILIGLGKDKLNPAYQLALNGSLFLSSARISSNSWVKTTSNNDTALINKKLEMLIGLSTNSTDGSAEEFQVNNYGTSGVYRPHTDYFPKHLEEDKKFVGYKDGNRMATVMYYLSDVMSGGATVFPYIGATVWPRKGDVVFWWNVKPNGESDPMTKHGGCPVLFGTKWVANRWIRSHGQMFRRPCDVEGEHYFETI